MLDLPKKFKMDTMSSETYLIPLIVIDDRMFLSNNKISFRDKNLEIVHYDPLVKNISKIRQSIDIIDKIFRVSEVDMTCYNYEYNGQTITDRLRKKSFMGKEIEIFYRSPSAESLHDCLSVYKGFIKNVEENGEMVKIKAEDRSERGLHKELPQRYVTLENPDIPNIQKNKPIPMVYGTVSKAPCVFLDLQNSYVDNDQQFPAMYEVGVDDHPIKQVTYPYIFKNGVYMNISNWAGYFNANIWNTIYKNCTPYQYQYNSDGTRLLFQQDLQLDTSDGQTNVNNITSAPPGLNLIECYRHDDVKLRGAVYDFRYSENQVDDGWNLFKNPLRVFSESTGTVETTFDNFQASYIMCKDFGLIDTIMLDGLWFWGDNSLFNNTYIDNGATPKYGTWGESVFSFEADEIFDSGSLFTKWPTDNQGNYDERPEGHRAMTYNIEVQMYTLDELADAYDATYSGNTYAFHPQFYANFSDSDIFLWDLADSITSGSDTDEYYHKTTTTSGYQAVSSVCENTFSINSRKPNFVPDQRGILKYIKFNSLRLRRRVILKGFKSQKICANTAGRVDEVGGRYTGQSS